MAMWIRDFQSDTEGLDAEMTGAYVMLMFSMWTNGGWLRDDDRALARIARVSRFKWRRLKPIIMAFMTPLDGNRFTQKRLLRELWLSREFGKFPARTVTRVFGQQEFDFDGFSVATRERARGHSQSHPEKEQKERRLGLAREAAARGVLPPAEPVSDELRQLIIKMGLDR
jgi:uncharacterized protein YdaU (DUF1376 family)